MSKLIVALLVTIVLFSIASCSSAQKIAALKPEPDNAAPLVYDHPASVINMPITIKIQDIENQVNKFLTGQIYEDNTIEDDNYTVKVWKQAPIQLSNTDGKIKTILPLKAIVNYRIGTLGLYTTREINLNGTITLLSQVALTNWKLSTQTTLESLNWNESPTMSIAGKELPITYLVAPAIKLFKSKIERNIDEAIKKSVDFKPNVLDALEKICTPSQINVDYDTWLRIVPLELYTTDAVLKNQTINLQMGLKCNIETLVGQKPETKFDRNKILLKPISKMPNTLDANLVAVSTYADASRIMNKNFQGKEFGTDSKKVTVQNVNIWHKNGKMVIALDLLGSLNGTIYLNGFPQYNPETKEIFFDQLDYAIDTKNKLIRTANWLASGLVLRKMQQTCRYTIKPNLDEGKKSMLQYLNNFSPMPGVFVNGNISDIDFQKIQLTNQAIIAFLNISGNVSINVDGLK